MRVAEVQRKTALEIARMLDLLERKRKNPARLAWIRTLPCACRAVPGADPCGGPMHAHHRTGGGMALKRDDSQTMPLCMKHHDDFHTSRGMFKHWARPARTAFQQGCVDALADKGPLLAEPDDEETF